MATIIDLMDQFERDRIAVQKVKEEFDRITRNPAVPPIAVEITQLNHQLELTRSQLHIKEQELEFSAKRLQIATADASKASERIGQLETELNQLQEEFERKAQKLQEALNNLNVHVETNNQLQCALEEAKKELQRLRASTAVDIKIQDELKRLSAEGAESKRKAAEYIRKYQECIQQFGPLMKQGLH